MVQNEPVVVVWLTRTMKELYYLYSLKVYRLNFREDNFPTEKPDKVISGNFCCDQVF